MVKHVSTLVENFPGAPNQARCFAHILNLVAKSVLRQFDAKEKEKDGGEDLDETTAALSALAQELDLEDGSVMPVLEDALEEEREEDDDGVDDDDDDASDDEDGLGDERAGMSAHDIVELDDDVVPIRLMLTKVNYNL
jgi:hypothetical protein